MDRENTGEEEQKLTLATETISAVRDFQRFLWEEEHRSALGEASWKHFDYIEREEESPGLEILLADIDPEQHKKALGLESTLAKLHGCVVSYKIPMRGEENPEEWIMYVKDHVIDLNTFGSWTVGICVEQAPVSQADADKRNWFIQPLESISDFQIIALQHTPTE